MKVSLDEVGGNTEKMIKKFLKKTKKMRIIEDVLDRRFYVKPSVKANLKRRAKQRALEKEKDAAENDSWRHCQCNHWQFLFSKFLSEEIYIV